MVFSQIIFLNLVKLDLLSKVWLIFEKVPCATKEEDSPYLMSGIFCIYLLSSADLWYILALKFVCLLLVWKIHLTVDY